MEMVVLVARGFLINDQIPGRNQMGGWEGQGRTHCDHTQAHLPAMNPDKALVGARAAPSGWKFGSKKKDFDQPVFKIR